MASSKKSHSRKHATKSSSNKRRSSSCSGGKSRRSSSKKKNGTRKWHQKGCQSGGGSVTGGWAWGPSDVQHAGSGGGVGGMSAVPQSINGNHYSLNTETMAPAQSSNHLVEKAQQHIGGASRKKDTRRSRRQRRFIGEQHGGVANYLPEVANTTARGLIETPANIVNSLQGASTAFVTSNPTIQPIAQPIQLK
jgi:hypothetical protein